MIKRRASFASRRLMTALAYAFLMLSFAGIAGCSSGSTGTPASPPVPPSPPPPLPPPPSPPPPPPPGAGTISGNLVYEFPPPRLACQGLDFANVQDRPIRRVTVQLIDPDTNIVLDSTVSDDNGDYTLNIPGQTNVFIRVRAELKSSAWDVEVRNNVLENPVGENPQPLLGARPLYVMDSSINPASGNLKATTGWNTLQQRYGGPRVAAPFSILDAIYQAMLLITAEDPTVSFVPLDAFWSPDNTSTRGPGNFEQRAASGEIGTSFYSANRLFLLGKDGDDAEEFDDHVIVHEWGHYFEDNFSRSDSIGGAHSSGDELDMRVAFGEGFATALSGIALNSSEYCDTLWLGFTLSGFRIDIENANGPPPGERGWFNEFSVLELIYDLWDGNPDGADDSTIGFSPIYDVMVGPQSTTTAFTSIFTFATALKQQGTGQNTFIDNLLTEHAITATGIDAYGSTELNDGPGSPEDVLPLYTDISLGGAPERICVNSQFDSGSTGNKLSQHRYLRLNLAVPSQVTFSMTAVSPPSTPTPGFDCTADPDAPENSEHSDPDFIVYRNGQISVLGFSCEPNSEVTPPAFLAAGEYVIDLNEYRHEDDESPNGFPERMCFDFTASL